MLRERFLALLLIGLVPYPFFPEGSSIVGHSPVPEVSFLPAPYRG